jgi:hypothetical protein
MILGDPVTDRLWQFGPLELDQADHIFHIVLGTVFLACGLLSRRKTEQTNLSFEEAGRLGE